MPPHFLQPALHVKDAPEGWSAEDVDESELVDDDFIENDPNSWVADTPLSEEEDVEGPLTATGGQLSWNEIVLIAKRTGVENWPGGRVVAAPSSWRGKRGNMGTVVGVTRHHTGTAETFLADQDYPTYNVVKEGRSGLDNSLSAYGLGRWNSIYVFSEFLSWHAGTWSYAGITDGNGHFLGIEAEGTGARWTPFQQEFYPRLVASILLYVGEGTGMAPRHADGAMPRGRKSDAANLPADFMAKVAGYIANPSTLAYGAKAPAPTPTPKEIDDMPLLIQVKVTGGYVPHLLSGDRYAQIKTGSFAAALKAAGVPEVVCDNEEHANLVAQFASEKATLTLPPPPIA